MAENCKKCSESNESFCAEDIIKFCILEHACKHNMEAVLSEFYKMGPNTCHSIYASHKGGSPIFPMMLFLRRYLLPVCSYSHDENGNRLTCAIHILCHLRRHTSIIPLPCFVIFHTNLSLIVTLRLLKKGDLQKAICYMNRFFPPWSTDVEKQIMEAYRISEKCYVDRFRVTIGKCRRHVQIMMQMATRQHPDFEKVFDEACNRFMSPMTTLLPSFISKCLSPHLPSTVIENFIYDREEPESGETLFPPIRSLVEFVDRLKRFGETPSQVHLQELFLNVLSEIRNVKRTASDEQVDESTNTCFLSVCTDVVMEFQSTLSAGARSPSAASSDSGWINSPMLGLSPQSRKRIGREYEEATKTSTSITPVKSSTDTAAVKTVTQTTPVKASNETVPVKASTDTAQVKTSIEKASAENAGPSCAIATSSPSISPSPSSLAKSTQPGRDHSYCHLPPKKRGPLHWFKQSARSSPSSERREMLVKMRLAKVMKIDGQTFRIFV